MKTWGAAKQTHRKRVRPNGVHHRVYCGTLSQRCTSILRTTCSSVLCQFCCTILYLCGSVGHMSCLWKSTVPVYSQLSLSNATLTSAHHENQLQDWCHINTDKQSVYRVPPLSVATESSLLAQQTLTLNANEEKKKSQKSKNTLNYFLTTVEMWGWDKDQERQEELGKEVRVQTGRL